MSAADLCGPVRSGALTRRLIAGGAVDGLPKQIGVAVVPGVLLDHVHIDPAQRIVMAPPAAEGVVEAGARRGLPGELALRLEGGEVGLGGEPVDVVEVAVGVLVAGVQGPKSSPRKPRRNHQRSTSDICRTSPSNDKVDGGADRWTNWSPVRFAHFHSSVARW